MQDTEIKYPANVCKQQKTGEEPVLLEDEIVATVADYWRWAHSDLNSSFPCAAEQRLGGKDKRNLNVVLGFR